MKRNLNPLYNLKEASSYLNQVKNENKLKIQQQIRKSPIKKINANRAEKATETLDANQAAQL